MTTVTTAPAPTPITLTVRNCTSNANYSATFTGPRADELAAAFVTARRSTHVVEGGEDFDFTASPLTEAAINPLCEHGMLEQMCAGPMHYPDERNPGYHPLVW